AEGVFGPEFDHLALQVSLDERWLADVGFGDSFVEPLLLDKAGEQVQPSGSYRIDRDGDALVLSEREPGGWKAQYRFTLQPRRLEDFSEMCRYHQTSPDSPFTRKPVCTLATEDGRVTLSERRLIRTVRGLAPAEETVETDERYKAALEQFFRVNLDRVEQG
ncbi:MAG TPA: arylamine N-acetyltransferase, partial [Blastocatellia bacterium]|nr:arylamine N-acetyltransferase [Blastocatellia bacterium]